MVGNVNNTMRRSNIQTTRPQKKREEENGKEIQFKDKMPENFARIDVKYESSDSEIRMNLKNKNK